MMMRPWYAAFLAGMALLAGCATVDAPAGGAASPRTAVFEWFDYTGKDAAFADPLPAGTYQNPILAGYHPDPSIVRVGDDYYMINSTFAFYPGIPVFHSRDLVNWTQIGNAIDRPDMMPFDKLHLGYNGVYAPAIEHRDGTFYIINTCIGCGGNFVITAKNPAGPWSDPLWLPHIEGIDPSIFFDDDGKTYVVHHAEPPNKRAGWHTAIKVMEVDPVTFAQKSDDVLLVDGGDPQPWPREYVEGPHLYKIDGKYLLSFPGGGTGYYHGQLAYRADKVFGPYEPNPANPFLTQYGLPDDRPAPVTSTGHGDMVEDQNGQWWIVFLGTRPFDLTTPPQDPGRFVTGRETFMLPVTWKDGWPVVIKDQPLPLRPQRPNLPDAGAPAVPTTGNFILRDEFEDGKLAPQWLFIRTPHQTWWRTGDGRLTLEPREDRLGSTGQPSFIGRRVQHMTASAATKMTFVPRSPGEEAGMLAIQNDENYYAFGVGLNAAGERVLRVRKRQGGQDPESGRVIAEQVLAAGTGATLHLRVNLDRGRIGFDWSTDGATWSTLIQNAQSYPLTTAAAGGFTGAVIGMYAEGN